MLGRVDTGCAANLAAPDEHFISNDRDITDRRELAPL
jgi:hypothetical protein